MKMLVSLLMITSLLWLKSLAQSTLPVATVTPTLDTLSPTGSATLSCLITGMTSSSRVAWRRNDMPISAAANTAFNGNNLTVSNFSVDFAGNYTCVATNEVGTVSSNPAVLQLAEHDASFFSTDVGSPHMVTVVENEPTAVDCGPFRNTPPSDIQWEVKFGFFDDVTLGNERATVGLNQSLYLLEPMQADNFVLSCSLRNTALERFTTGYVTINIQASTSPAPEPFILVEPKDVTTWIGQTVSFECIPAGRGAAGMVAVWMPMPANGRTTDNGFRLKISNIDADSVGTYSCTIDDIAGTYSATLTLIEPPVLSTFPPTNLAPLTYGDPLSLACSSSTPQDTSWEWFHNGIRLPSASGAASFMVESTTLEDAGSYQCFASNPAGYRQATTLVQVNTIAAEITTVLPAMQVVFRDHPFSLSCSAQGAPPPTYTWLKYETPLESGSTFELSESGGLLIRSIEASSEGLYQCMATNTLPDGTPVGMDSAATNLTTIRPTVIERQLDTLFSVQVATPTTLPCEVSHEVEASVHFSWLKDDEPLTLNEHVQLQRNGSLHISTGSLHISTVVFDDSGHYQCIVSTSYEGLQAPVVRSTRTTVQVTETPVAPTTTGIASTSPNSFQIQWVFSGSPTFVRNYTIEIQSPPNSNSTWIPIHTQSVSAITSANVSSEALQAFTCYGIRVVATYADGSRVLSEQVVVRTGTDRPLDSPKMVMATAPNNMALSISWKHPATPRGEIIHYIVEYRMKGDSSFKSISTPNNDTNYTIDDLAEFKKFEIRVAAVTSAGQGPFSPSIEAATVKGGGLSEPESRDFVSSVGFIVLIVALVLFLMVSAVVVATVTKYKCSKEKAARNYEFRHSMVGTDKTDANLSEDAMASYGRQKAFGSISPSSSRRDNLDVNLEAGSSYGGTMTSGTPQLSTGSGVRLLHAPSYIDPPPFEEMLKNRSRSHSANSAYSRDVHEPVRDWDDRYEAGMQFNNNTYAGGDDSDTSIEKNTADFASEDTDRESEHTQYSHLAGAFQGKQPLGGPTFHHQLNIPLSASSSAGVPMTFGEMVDNRLLREQPDDAEMPLSHATYV